MKKLTEADIIRLMREEWDAKVSRLSEEVDVLFKGKVDGKEKPLIGVGLKIRHKESQLLYTVDSVSPRDAVLQAPEGDKFLVDKTSLEDEYEID